MITSLLVGAAVGTVASKLGIKTEVILGTGLVIGAITGTLSLPLGLGIMGACIVSGLKDLVYNTNQETIKEEKTELEEIEELFNNFIPIEKTETEKEEEKETKIVKEVKGSFTSHLSTLIIGAPILILLNTITGLSTFIYPVSVIVIIISAWLSLTNNTIITNIKNILGLTIVGVLALYTLLNVSSGGSFMYFLSLISIPSLLIKFNNKDKKQDTSLFNIKNNFMYGNNSATLPVVGGGISLLQTIVMGSGQDMLGTLINGDSSILLDPYRLSILAVVVGITTIFGATLLRKDKHIINSINSNNKPIINKIAKLATIIASFAVVVTQFNPLIGFVTVCAGITTKLLLKNNTNKVAIASLLIVGGLSNF